MGDATRFSLNKPPSWPLIWKTRIDLADKDSFASRHKNLLIFACRLLTPSRFVTAIDM